MFNHIVEAGGDRRHEGRAEGQAFVRHHNIGDGQFSMPKQAVEQVLFALEVSIDGAGGDPGVAGDRLDRETSQSRRLDLLQGGAQDFLRFGLIFLPRRPKMNLYSIYGKI